MPAGTFVRAGLPRAEPDEAPRRPGDAAREPRRGRRARSGDAPERRRRGARRDAPMERGVAGTPVSRYPPVDARVFTSFNVAASAGSPLGEPIVLAAPPPTSEASSESDFADDPHLRKMEKVLSLSATQRDLGVTFGKHAQGAWAEDVPAGSHGAEIGLKVGSLIFFEPLEILETFDHFQQ